MIIRAIIFDVAVKSSEATSKNASGL